MNDSSLSEASITLVRDFPPMDATERERLQRKVQAALASVGLCRCGAVQVTIEGDCIRLTGFVSTYYVKQQVQEAARKAAGDNCIENLLCVSRDVID